jgi:hypothetical protein
MNERKHNHHRREEPDGEHIHPDSDFLTPLRHSRFRVGIPLRTPLAVPEEDVATNPSAAAFTGPYDLRVLTKGLHSVRHIFARIRRKIH